MDEIKAEFRDWCLYANGNSDKGLNFGRFMRWLKQCGMLDRHFVPREAEQAFRQVMHEHADSEAKKRFKRSGSQSQDQQNSPLSSPYRCPSVASMAGSVATGAGDERGERMPYHVFRLKLLPTLAAKLRCTSGDLIKRFQYCGGPKEVSPKRRIDIFPSTN
jgi:hypothetical protein